MASRAKVATLPEYLAMFEPRQVRLLRSVFATIRKSVPGCTPCISYGIPAFKLGKVFIYCAAFKSHLGIYPPVRDDARLIAALKSHANSKGNLRFDFDMPLPLALISRVAKSLARSRSAGA